MAATSNTFSRQLPPEDRFERIISTYLQTSRLRPEILFRHFLPSGYRHTTLDRVPAELREATVLAKVHLGMIITLYDDFADHPQHRNANLLAALYLLNVGVDLPPTENLTPHERQSFALARHLFASLRETLSAFPNYFTLLAVLRFDLEQFYAANRYSELMTDLPAIRNVFESRLLSAHNMGIVAAGTIDLMASPSFDFGELGACRQLFHLGQRLGRISNLIFTLDREVREGDSTNEILISRLSQRDDEADYEIRLLREFPTLLAEIGAHHVNAFNCTRYAEGFVELHRLHATLVGQI